MCMGGQMANDDVKKSSMALRYQRLFETAQDGILILDYPEGLIIDANPYIVELLGYPKSFLVGKKLWEIGFIEDKQQALKIFQELIATSYVRYEHLNLRQFDGQSKAVEFVCNSYAVNGDTVIQCNIRDVSDRVKALKLSNEVVQLKIKNLNDIIRCLSTIVESRDPYTVGHQFRVSDLSVAIAKYLKLDNEIIEGIRIASLLHDIGKFKVPLELLIKPGKLMPEEFGLIKLHPLWGFNILKTINFKQDVPRFVLEHHERLDGSGYPYGLKNKQISLEAKIIAVADVVEAMTSNRTYRPALEMQKALAELANNQGKLYDVDSVRACIYLISHDAYRFPDYLLS
jgi:PAS domain S-box-containing protein/putative nucleotidyltransferase with HDIG domain